MRIRRFLVLAFVLVTVNCWARDVRIGVLGLFHPKTLEVRTGNARVIVVNGGVRRTLQPATDQRSLRVTLGNSALFIEDGSERLSADRVDVVAADSTDVISISVPGKITRKYRGTIDIEPSADQLAVIVEMDLETAVASVVAAELPRDTPIEAMKAQAVLARSYLSSPQQRHSGFDFCDTTHCQFLREPPADDSTAAAAARATTGLVLTYEGNVFPPMYARSCGGRTRSAVDVGLNPHPYPYFAVDCPVCIRSADRWRRRLSSDDAAALTSEYGRLQLARERGWDFLPSNSHSVKQVGGEFVVEGSGSGHGLGLCQKGAAEMARTGASFRDILRFYFPNTVLRSQGY